MRGDGKHNIITLFTYSSIHSHSQRLDSKLLNENVVLLCIEHHRQSQQHNIHKYNTHNTQRATSSYHIIREDENWNINTKTVYIDERKTSTVMRYVIMVVAVAL